METIRKILAELKQRHVIRVAGVYAVTTWAVFQVANALFPALGLPKWTVTLVAVLMMLGFPIACVLAWAYEKTPEGIRPADHEAAPKPRLAVMDWALVAATALVVGVSLAQMTGVGKALRLDRGAVARAPAAAPKSIAVLPFASFSDSRDAGFFADGLTEELINSLAQIPDLKVAGRTSAFYFKGKDADLREVGRKLGVSHVLEGSVRRDGDRIRVTAQLIKVSDGFHMWSQTYDRELDDALAIQTDIANTVAGVMKTKLMTAPAAGGGSPEAYRLTLAANGRVRQLGAENLLTARRMYQRAIALDPNHADALAGLAQANMLLAQNYMALEFDQARQQSEAVIAKALALQPRSVPAQTAAGLTYRILALRVGDPRYARRSEAAFKRALDIDPKNPDALVHYGNLLAAEERPLEAVAVLKRALEVDPLNRVALVSMAEAMAGSGKVDEAVEAYKAVIALYPDYVDAPEELGSVLVGYGRLDEAEPYLRRAARAETDPSAAVRLSHLYLTLGMTAEARQTLTRIRKPPAAVNLIRAITYIVDRDYRGLVDFAERRYAEDKDPFWPSVIGVAALRLGDDRKVLEQVRISAPELLGPNPTVGGELNVPLGAAHALNGLGLKDQAGRILKVMLDATAAKPDRPITPSTRLRRAQIYAELGDQARAMQELKAAVDAGYRALYDFEDFTRLDESVHFEPLRGDPGFRALIARLEAENQRMRERVLARRRSEGGVRS